MCVHHVIIMANIIPGQTHNYFGKRVSVLFDDGRWYSGVIIRKDKTNQWVTKFEDGTEDSTKYNRLSKGQRLQAVGLVPEVAVCSHNAL